MRRPPESKTPLWRSSCWRGRGCWVKSNRVSFMGFSPFCSAVRRKRSSPHAALQQCGQEPSDRRDGRFSATLGAEGGTHRLVANSIDYAEAKQREGHAPEYVEWAFCAVRRYGVLGGRVQANRANRAPTRRAPMPTATAMLCLWSCPPLRALALLLLVEAVDATVRTAEASVGVPHLLHAG